MLEKDFHSRIKDAFESIFSSIIWIDDDVDISCHCARYKGYKEGKEHVQYSEK